MPVLRQGCVGAVSCESVPTLGGTAAVCDIGNGVPHRFKPSDRSFVPPARCTRSVTSLFHLDPAGRTRQPTMAARAGRTTAGKPFDTRDPACSLHRYTGRPDPGPVRRRDLGHSMGVARRLRSRQTAVQHRSQEPRCRRRRSQCVGFQDDNPLNGEKRCRRRAWTHRAHEPGLGRLRIQAVRPGRAAGRCDRPDHVRPFQQPFPTRWPEIDPVSAWTRASQRPDPRSA